MFHGVLARWGGIPCEASRQQGRLRTPNINRSHRFASQSPIHHCNAPRVSRDGPGGVLGGFGSTFDFPVVSSFFLLMGVYTPLYG